MTTLGHSNCSRRSAFGDPTSDRSLRFRIAAELLPTDPVKAESIITAIESPEQRARGYVWLAEELPDGERDRKRALLERAATVWARVPAVPVAEPESRLQWLVRFGGAWLDAGEVEKARPLIREGLKMFAALPNPGPYLSRALATAARLELEPVLDLIRDQNEPLASRLLRRDRRRVGERASGRSGACLRADR